MRIDASYIGFDSLEAFTRFISEQGLIGGFQLAEPVKDKAGNILIKEKIYVKESAIKRLESMDGNFDPDFRIAVDEEIIKKLRAGLGKKIVACLDETEAHFVRHLFESSRVNYQAYIQNAFATNMLVLTFYKQLHDNADFFRHAAKLGLLALGVIVQRSFGIPRLHRYAFLSGFMAEVPLAATGEWQGSIPDGRRQECAEAASKLASRLNMPAEIVESLKKYPINLDRPALQESPIPIIDPSAAAAEPEGEPEPGRPADPASTEALTGVLRLAMFIHEASKEIVDPAERAEKIVPMVAYNGARGYFHKELVELIIERFREYESIARRMMKIAKVEAGCLHPPSAWAYPKPRAAQVLCRHFKTGCPRLESGWDIHVVSPQEAYGWLGIPLDAGSYPKCSLEQELPDAD